MTIRDYDEHVFGSTTWGWRREIISTPPQAPAKRRPKAVRRPSLATRDRRSPLTISVVYRGGSAAWYQIRARGETYRCEGSTAIHDVMEWINSGDTGRFSQ